MPSDRIAAAMLGLALTTAVPDLATADDRSGHGSPCAQWGPQISEHLDWVCAHGAPRSGRIYERPPAQAICWTMNEHISDLLNRHRLATEMDEADFHAALQKFYEAQTTCEAGRYDEALSLYTLVPVRRPQTLLR
jgi:hypothetical protein